MGFFKKDYNKPGPGVPKNAPRKKGIARFIEILGRDFGNLVKLNLLFFACAFPAILLFIWAILNIGIGGFLFWAFLAWIASFPVGPALTAMHYLITKMLRDDPGFIWHDFKKAFKENFKETLLPGMLYTLVIGSQVLSFFYYMAGSAQGQMSFPILVLYLFSVLLFAMAAPYFFIQKPYLDLKNGGVIKNSLLLAIGNAPRSFAGALFGTGLLILQILFFPASFLFLILIGFTIPCLINLMWVWPPIDKVFGIEKTLRQRAGQEFLEEDEASEQGSEKKEEEKTEVEDASEKDVEETQK